jgi:hypothetical protein
MADSSSSPRDAFNSLDAELPSDATALLEACQGKRDSHGEALAWSVAELRARNREMRTTPAFRSLYMSFDNLLFFGDSGNGDLFALAIDADGKVRRRDVFCWDHETDGRVWFANGTSEYIAKRLAPAE